MTSNRRGGFKSIGLVLAASLLASACGSGGGNGLSSEEIDGPTTTPGVTLGAADETIDGGSSPDTVDKGPVVLGMDDLPDGDSGDAILAIVEDIHGPTDDVGREMNRLIPFANVPTPSGAHIVALSITPSVEYDDNRSRVRGDVTFVADGSPEDLEAFFEAQLVAEGWERVGAKNDTDYNNNNYTEISFEIPDNDFNKIQNLDVRVTDDSEFPKTLINVNFRQGGLEDITIASRLSNWYGNFPVPDGGTIEYETLETRFGAGRTSTDVTTALSYETSPASTEEEFESLIVDQASTAGRDAELGQYGGVDVNDSNFDSLAVRVSSTDRIYIRGEDKFLTPSFDGVKVVAEEKSTTPLPKLASREEIEAVVNEVHGPTADVSAQMQRLGLFPSIPTPNGADVIEVSSIIGNVIGSETELASTSEVTMFIDGGFDDVVTFYQTQSGALGWTLASEETESQDEGQTTINTYNYAIEGVDAGTRDPVALTIADDVDEARTKVTIRYTEFVPIDDSGIERWLGWQGEAPVPSGERVESAGVSTDGLFGSAIFYVIDYAYDDQVEADVLAAVEKAIPASDFSLDPDDSSDFRIGLTHEYFTEASIRAAEFSNRTRVTLEASRPLGQQ